MLEAQDLNAVANLEEATAKVNNSNTIAIAVGGAMLAIGAGVGYLLGNRKGVKKGEESMKASMQPEMDNLRTSVKELKDSLSPAS